MIKFIIEKSEVCIYGEKKNTNQNYYNKLVSGLIRVIHNQFSQFKKKKKKQRDS